MTAQVSSAQFSRRSLLIATLPLALAACGSNSSGSGSSTALTTVHLAYFPNFTHAVALVGTERNTFKQTLSPNTLSIKTFNAGPDLINALLAGSIDIGYVGPNPAINGYVQSNGGGLRIIAGAASGGASFIVRPAANIKTAADLSGKRLSDPQKGGTQDISLRHYLQTQGLKTDDQGGTVHISPTDNASILTEFEQGQIDGAWVPEPWASRLVLEGKGTVFVDERDLWPNRAFVTTNVVVRKDFLDQHPDAVKKFLQAHVETVQYIKANPSETRTDVNNQLKQLTTKALKDNVLDRASNNLEITYDPLAKTLFEAADNAYALGLLKSKPDKNIYDLTLLNEVLTSKGLTTVSAT